MMTTEEIVSELDEGRGFPAFDELKHELQLGALRHISSGEMSAREAAATFAIRHSTTKNAGIDTIGFEVAGTALANEPEETRIKLHHFKSPRGVFTVFAVGALVLGCIRVPQR